MSQSTVGIIANPASGKDIRRLVAHSTVFDNQEKTNIVRRLILACLHSGVDRILFMPDYHGLVEKAITGLSFDYHRLSLREVINNSDLSEDIKTTAKKLSSFMHTKSDEKIDKLELITVFLRHDSKLPLIVEPVDMVLTATQNDSRVAAEKMEKAGCNCILVLGGDGTSRQAAKGTCNVPLLPISTGTNNVFPYMVEATTAGLAASAVAQGKAGKKAIYRAKRLVITKNGEPVDMALVDAVVTSGHFIGSKAMWEIENMIEAAFTRGEPDNIGLASIIGKLKPVKPHDRFGAWVTFCHDRRDVFAPIAPGLFKPVGIKESYQLELGDEKPISKTPSLVALDGEREVELTENDSASIWLDQDGPLVVDINAALEGAVANGFFTDSKFLNKFN